MVDDILHSTIKFFNSSSEKMKNEERIQIYFILSRSALVLII